MRSNENDGSAERLARTTTIKVFGRELTVKNYDCAMNGGEYREKPRPIRLQLFITPTYFCPGNCAFCVAHASRRSRGFLDIEKLRRVLQEMKDADMLRTISITGGEPLYDMELLDEIIELIFEVCGLQTDISINTSGYGLDRIDRIRNLAFLHAIHISRHHYDDEKNQAYFGMKVPAGAQIAQMMDIVKDPKLFLFNCLLLKDGIGTKEEMIRFLEFAGSIGMPKAGFITPMPVNDYVRANRVSYAELLDRKDHRVLFTTGYCDHEYCHCQDGVYVTREGKLVEWYGRETVYGGAAYVRGFVYGADNILRDGFAADANVLFRP